MIAATDLSAIRIFSELTPEERQHYAMKSADVRLRPGEWLVREGERSGFFVLLEGKVLFTKDIHGQEYEVRIELAHHLNGSAPSQGPVRFDRVDLDDLIEQLRVRPRDGSSAVSRR
jgi:thioredoxin reductase (NADPH)